MRRYFLPKRLPDGRSLINLGCGTHMHRAWNNLDFSVYAWLRRHMWLVQFLHRAGLISSERFTKFTQIQPDIIAWDLRCGIPFADMTFDVVYHCHLLEHIERQTAPGFLRECRRVLKYGGVLRVVVPDLEKWARDYMASLSSQKNGGDISVHEQIVAEHLDQIVRREPATRRFQRPVVRAVERLLLGDSAATGDQHRWMYDWHTLKALLQATGFHDCQRVSAATSRAAGWQEWGLEINADGTEYHPGSLRVESLA